MKSLYKLLFIVVLLFTVTACKKVDDEFQLIVNEKSTEFYIGETEVDFKSYFTIKGKDGKVITVEDSMVDATKVNFNQEGTYKVKLVYNGLEKEIEIKVSKRNIVTYSIIINEAISTHIKKGKSDFDFKQFFAIKDSNENSIDVLDSYIDKSTVDFAKEGTYVVKITYQDVTKDINIKIVNDEPQITYDITIVDNLPIIIEVGTNDIDYKSYFKITDSKANNIEVLDSMINVSNVDVTKAGKFVIVLNFNDLVQELEFSVIEKPVKTNSSDLFISEYAEGKGYDKYIEIFNGTGESIDLTNYSVALFNNSKEPAQYTASLSGTLKDGELFIIYNPSASTLIKTNSNLASKVTDFNGNDVVALYNKETLIDIIGSIASPVSIGWDVGEVKEATLDHTLIRKSNVYDPNNTFTANEWNVLDNEDFSNIKKHTMDNYIPKKGEDIDPNDPPKERVKDIFISEYFEGDVAYKDSKYIEIYNGLGVDVDLNNYSLALYKGGSTSPSFTQPLTGTLKDKNVFIVYTPYSVDEIKNKGNLSSEVCYFNGTGAIALLKNDEVIDVIGVIGEYPTEGWIVDDFSTTANNTIIRKETIDSPTDKWDASEWYPCYDNYLYDIGNHNQWNNNELVYDNFDQVINMIKDLELDSKGTAISESSIKIKGTIFMDVNSETSLVYITDGRNFVKLYGEKIHNYTSPGAVYEVVVYYKVHLYQPTFEVVNPSSNIKVLSGETPITEVEYMEVTLAEILALKKEDFALNITNGYLQSLLKITGYLQYDNHNSTRFDYCLTVNETYSKNDTGYINNGLYFKNDVESLENDLYDYEVISGEENVQIDIYGVVYDWNPNRKNWRIYVAEDITIFNLNN